MTAEHETCSTCRWSKKDWTKTNPISPDHYCANEDSEEFSHNVEGLDGCEEYERRR